MQTTESKAIKAKEEKAREMNMAFIDIEFIDELRAMGIIPTLGMEGSFNMRHVVM